MSPGTQRTTSTAVIAAPITAMNARELLSLEQNLIELTNWVYIPLILVCRFNILLLLFSYNTCSVSLFTELRISIK